MTIKRRVAIVAVETNLIGERVRPHIVRQEANERLIHPGWPFAARGVKGSLLDPQDIIEWEAEIVAVFVGFLDEGGTLRFTLRGNESGSLKTTGEDGFTLLWEGQQGDHWR